MSDNLRINTQRLLDRIQALGKIGALEGGGVCRLALSDDDKAGRDLVISWMRELGLRISIDGIGNVIGLRPGREDGAPVMTGSHIDTVRTGGLYDGNLGVLAGLEVIQVLNDANIQTRRPLAVGFFTNEEGARFAPDMMGSLVYVGGLELEQALATTGIDGSSVGDNLDRIGYCGEAACGTPEVHAFVELHVEQGPLLEQEGVTLGAVTGVQGISWTEFTVYGVSNHAGTTPMSLRHDAAYLAGATIQFVRMLSGQIEGQLATVGHLKLFPDLVNVIPNKAVFTVDLRNTDNALLQQAEQRLHDFLREMAVKEGVRVEHRSLARFEPVAFEPAMVERIERNARALGHSIRRMPSGAGHDAQMLARVCPTAMIFTPSVGGISHNIKEYTAPADIEAGANVLLSTLLQLANE
ncbi:MAG: Zn-dependent hydrolase [Gammaproteobacteria bacterium]